MRVSLNIISRVNIQKIDAPVSIETFMWLIEDMPERGYGYIETVMAVLRSLAGNDLMKGNVIQLLTFLLDRRYNIGRMRRRSILQMVTTTLDSIFTSLPLPQEG